METRQIDVSRLAELSTVALLAGKVRLSLDAVEKGRQLDDFQAHRIRRAAIYLDRLMKGLEELKASQGTIRALPPVELNAVTSYRIAASAYSRSSQIPASRTLAGEDLRDIEQVLTRIKSLLEQLLRGYPTEPEEIDLADRFFAALASYARDEHAEMLRSTPL